MRSILSLAFVGAAICASAQDKQPPANPEPVAPVVIVPPKMLIDPKQPLLLRYLKKCSDAVTVTAVPGTEQFLLDTSAMNLKWAGTLFNMAGDEITTFKSSVRTAKFAEQVCAYFEGLKASPDSSQGNQ